MVWASYVITPCKPYSLNQVHGRIRVSDQLVCHTDWNLRETIKELERPSFALVTDVGCKAHSSTLGREGELSCGRRGKRDSAQNLPWHN